MKLVIAEKPSVAMSIAKVLGVNKRQNGYMEGKDYIVSWCVGHLIQMANPQAYDEKYAKWNIKDLPIAPSKYKYNVSKNTKTQYEILKKLMHNKEIDTVINACDAGREGESIFRLVYNQAGCKKPIERLWISSMEDSAIKDGFSNLKPGKEYNNLFEAAEARAIADWLVGMNLSRLYSNLYNINYSVGRVQTPTLALIVNRDDEIVNFQKEKYYTVDLELDNFTLSTDRIDEPETSQRLKDYIGEIIKISNVSSQEKITKPELPFDLTTLQRECNKYFGFSAKETLDYAQKLYEKKLITYPRTDSRCLTEDMITSTVNNILGKYDFDTKRLPAVFNSKKVTDHHAIIPTISSIKADITDLSANENQVYTLIVDKLHASVGYPLIEKTTKITATVDMDGKNYEFKTSGKIIIEEGFSKFLTRYKTKKTDEILPVINTDDVFPIRKKEIKEKFTTPPKHYTEDTLLKAMETAGNEALDKGVEVERSGIGTPATRAGIIENLISKGFIEREKKNLLATNKGVSLVTIVADNFKSAKTTALWEMELNKIANGKTNKDVFINEILTEITQIIEKYQTKE